MFELEQNIGCGINSLFFVVGEVEKDIAVAVVGSYLLRIGTADYGDDDDDDGGDGEEEVEVVGEVHIVVVEHYYYYHLQKGDAQQ